MGGSVCSAKSRDDVYLLQESFKSSPHAICLLRIDRTIEHCNGEALRMLGYESSEELKGEDGLSLVAPEDRAKALRNYQHIVVTGIPDKDVEYKFIKKDGASLPVIVSAGLIRNVKGDPVYMIIIGRNITWEKEVTRRIVETEIKLNELLRGTIRVLSRAVEQRDPYTAGHQLRVTHIALAIGKRLGYSLEELEVLEIASMIHDVGKISIPAEILTKPGSLSETERGLLQQHPSNAQVILGEIESLAHIAQIISQHHERLDGSGYPQGLKREEILPEAKILAVADVVEAMSSYRPYRPALGIGKALEHIEVNRGKLYDEAVVDICLKLFREEGFQPGEAQP